MSSDEPARDSYTFFTDCCDAIGRGQYRDGLEILDEGLSRLIQSAEELDGKRLVIDFWAVVNALESTLQKAYGDKWEERAGIPKPPREDDKLRCSFCGKHHGEVLKLIAGPNVYICNECVDICNEIITDTAS